MSERLIKFPDNRRFSTIQIMSDLLNRIRGIRQTTETTDADSEPPVDFKLRWEAKRKPQLLKELGKSWAWAKSTGFGTNPFVSKEKVVPSGETWVVYTNRDPAIWRKPKRGSGRWQNSEGRPHLSLIEN